MRKPGLCSARGRSRAGVALMSRSWAMVSGGELAGEDEFPHVLGRVVAEPRATTLAPGRFHAELKARLREAYHTRCRRVESSTGCGCRSAASLWSPRDRPRGRHRPAGGVRGK